MTVCYIAEASAARITLGAGTASIKPLKDVRRCFEGAAGAFERPAEPQTRFPHLVDVDKHWM